MTLLSRHRLVRAAAPALLAAGMFLPAVALPAAAEARTALPPGVIQLNDGEPCPPGTLCLYRDYGRNGPAYGVGAGYDVDLRELPMAGRTGTAAENVSSWVNRTSSPVVLIDNRGPERVLYPGQGLEEPQGSNDSVGRLAWEL